MGECISLCAVAADVHHIYNIESTATSFLYIGVYILALGFERIGTIFVIWGTK